MAPRKEPNGEAVKASSEVDFALVLSRTISSVIADPEQLRTTVYELAGTSCMSRSPTKLPTR